MNKFFTKVASLCVGLAMAAGVGVAVSSVKPEKVKAAEGDSVTDVAKIVSGQAYYIMATVSGTDYYWKANGGVNVDKVLSGSSTTNVSEAAKVTLIGSGSAWAIKLSSGNYLSLPSSKKNGKYDVVSGSVNWTVTNSDGLLNFKINGYCLMKNSSTSLNFGSYASGQKNVWLKEGPADKTISSITLSKDDDAVKKEYFVGQASSTNGLTVTANYTDSTYADITSSATITPSPATVSLATQSISYTATFSTFTSNTVTVTGLTVTDPNPIQLLYSKTSGASVDVYGYYVGFLDGTGPVIMDGAYGIVVYNKTASVSGYTEGTTILHVTGSISIFNGLYEIGSATMSIASGTFDQPDTPVVYSATGNETAEYASRLTTVTGTPSLTSGSFDSAAGTADIKLNFVVGTKIVQVFYKKTAQTADADAFAAIKQAVADSSEITIKGFTGWYNGFQVQMNGYVPEAEDYTAEDFAQDLLNQTNTICEGYVDGESSYNEFKTALEAVWNDLASDDKYPSLPSGEKTVLADANRDESGTVIEQAMARYDYLTGKYELSNFINGRTPMSFSNVFHFEGNSYDSSATIIVVIVAITSITLLGTTLVIRKRKHQ